MFFLTSTTWYVLLHFRTFSCTSTHKSCYAAGRSLALPHIRHASSCYAAGRSLALPHIRHATPAGCSLALPQIRHASSCYAAGRSLAKKGTFPRSSQGTKLQFCCGKTLDFPILRRPFHGILMEIC